VPKKHFPISLLFVAVGMAIARSAFSAPVDFAHTPADAVWIVHADFDALRKSTTWQKVFDRAIARWKPLAGQLAKVNSELGMDIAKDLHGMTVFGPKLSAGSALLVMRADWDPQTFRQKLALAPDHSVSSAGRYEIHRFSRKDQGQLRSVAGACWQPGTFVFGQSASDVQLGLDVLDGRRPRLAGSGSPLADEAPAGTVFLARMTAAGDLLPVESPLLKQAEQIELACGEKGGECFARGKLVVKTAEGARQIKPAIDGLLALTRLSVAGDAAAVKLLDRVAVRVDGRTVRLDFRAPAGDLADVLEKAIDKSDPAKTK
jgi:hypothetical protein